MSTFDLQSIGAGLPAAGLIPQLTASARPDGVIRAVVEAPPGTGKTTLVPPFMADRAQESPAGGHRPGRVIVTQPRRIAARSAAQRLAQLSQTSVGDEAGFTVRGERKASARTRVEFVTTGVLLRRLLRDPELSDVSCVILDEVHERQLVSDLTFGMIGQVAQMREDLSLIAMSATLDATRWADLLGTDGAPAPVAAVEGTAFPLTEKWAPPSSAAQDSRGITPAFLRHVAATVDDARQAVDGDVLVFLPGAREIDRVATDLRNRAEDTDVLTLTGRTPPQEQSRILSPRKEPSGRQRLVLATNVAESALTVPGVRLVVDAGLDRQQRFDTIRGMSGLVTVGASKAAMVQRAGRAAREAPGTVVRCLSSADYAARPAATPPEIATSDLTSAVLSLSCWGSPGGSGLRLPDPLPDRAHERARSVLRALGAVDSSEKATDLGHRLAALPTDPRLARALFDGAEIVGARAAAEAVAAIESDQRAPGTDLWALVRQLRRSGGDQWRKEVRRFEAELQASKGGAPATEDDVALVTALAFPDRIARLRSAADAEYLMASGTGAILPRDAALKGQQWLAVAEVGLDHGRAMIRAAAVLDPDAAQLAGAELLRAEEIAAFETAGNGASKVSSRRVKALGAIELSSTPCKPSREAGRKAVADALARHGLRDFLRPGHTFDVLRGRMGLLHEVFGEPWPDVTLEALVDGVEGWFGDGLDRIASGQAPGRLDVASALRGLLPWPEASRLETLVPERLEVPSGSMVRLEWPDPEDHRDGHLAPPVLAVKLQECFGWREGPTVCGGRVPVLLHLLSPARRPLAVTQDLTSFWENVYPQVRAENRGRYIKHPWPEDPWNAVPTARTSRTGRK